MKPSGKADGMTYDHEGRLVVAGWSSRTVWRLEHDGSTTILACRRKGSITQRARGLWQVRYYGPLEPNAKQKRLTETVSGNKSASERLLRERLAAIENGGFSSARVSALEFITGNICPR